MNIKGLVPAITLFSCLLFAVHANAGEIEQNRFGVMADGTVVEAITLTNRAATSMTIITYGAAIQALKIGDKNGQMVDVALGYNTLDEYVAKRQFMGATVGRVANRVANARFSLNGKSYRVSANEGDNALHGGTSGFDTAVWTLKGVEKGADYTRVILTLASPDGDQGYPGNLASTVSYRLSDDNSLSIDYSASTDKDTVVNLSNHAYWNLAGEGSAGGAMGLVLQIPAQTFLPVDEELIPTGEFQSVAGTVFDFRKPQVIGAGVRAAAEAQIIIGRGYDHNWVITKSVTADLHLMARVTAPENGIGMELWSNQPGLQFYSGNFMDASTQGKAGQLYRQGDAIVLEPQTFPNAVNQAEFGSVVLKPGQTYSNKMVYKFFTEK